jgi:hypothetical protein
MSHQNLSRLTNFFCKNMGSYRDHFFTNHGSCYTLSYTVKMASFSCIKKVSICKQADSKMHRSYHELNASENEELLPHYSSICLSIVLMHFGISPLTN